MEDMRGTPREIAVPASILVTLREALTEECGPAAAIRALHAAGQREGGHAAVSFARGHPDGSASLAQDAFWSRLRVFFSRRGWGDLSMTAAHQAIGLLSSTDWAEAAQGGPGSDPSCAFTTGFLSGFLSHVAGWPVTVSEVTCTARGDDACTFAFGSEAAVNDLGTRLSEGAALADALATL